MDQEIITYIVEGLLSVVCFLLWNDRTELKNKQTKLEDELGVLKDKAFKKEDFTDFKKELWERLNRMEDDFKNQIQELKK